MNKGFILDGYPRNGEDAKTIFLNPIPGYGEEVDGEAAALEESKSKGED